MNTQRLLDLVHNNETASMFNLGTWLSECGTYGCLVGNDYIAGNTQLSRCDDMFEMNGIAKWYGVTFLEADYLFASVNTTYWFDPLLCFSVTGHSTRDFHNKESALDRVRKFIYYKLHKADMMSDPKYRRLEGDHNVCGQVVSQLEGALV